MEQEKFIVKIIGILFDPEKRRILVGKGDKEEEFSFLEGNLKYNSELDIELKKIAKEKTGYKIHNLGAVYARNKIKNKEEILELYFLCEATEGSEKPGANIEELIWIKPSEVEEKLNQKFPTRLKEYIINLE